MGGDILDAGKLASYKTQSLPLRAGRGRTAICVLGPERGHTARGNSGPGRYARCGWWAHMSLGLCPQQRKLNGNQEETERD